MAEYVVTWRIEVDADTPEEAAREAQRIQREPDSHATVFQVQEGSAHSSGDPLPPVIIDLKGK